MRPPFIACALIAAFAGLGQAATATVARTPSAVTNRLSAAKTKMPPRGLNDAAIEQMIKMKLAKSKIGADHFTIKVQNGVATWEGKTDVIQHKGAATRMAKTAGAQAVVNNIQISEAARRRAANRLAGLAPGTPIQRAQVKRPDPPTR